MMEFFFGGVEPVDPGSGGVSGGGGSPKRPEDETLQPDELRHGRTQSADGSRIQSDQRPHRHPVHTGSTFLPVQVLCRLQQQRGGRRLRHQRTGGQRLQQSEVGEVDGRCDAQQRRFRPSFLHICPDAVRGEQMVTHHFLSAVLCVVVLLVKCVCICLEPYAVKKLGAAAGVMITASHNPKEDNGYKVYWCNGAQISSPHDQEILQSIEEQLEPWSASCWEEELVESCSLRTDPLTQINSCYMDELTSLCFHRDLNSSCPLKFVHSSFHGVGHVFVQQAFYAFGFAPPIPVPEQKDPDPNFSSVCCPNPEEGESVLELSLLLAERENARIILATDPDADRLAVAEKSDGCGWKVFTGNELAALLGWWMFFNWKDAHPDPADTQKVYMLATTVSSKILQTFARIEGFHFEETLPGFKWIGNRIHELSKMGNNVIFAFEESIGFLCGGLVPEKDGVSSAVVVAEMAAYLHNKNLSLNQQLLNIYQTYGHHVSQTSYVVCDDPTTIQTIFCRIRNFNCEASYPKTCGGVRIVHVRDVTTGYDSSRPDLRSVLPVTRSSHMITFTLQNGVVATLRTSGTEPKIKCYTEYCAAPGTSEASCLEAELRRITAALLDEFLEPERNNLNRRCV
ncbi:glucose 1,6-bisphosphate synthase isoform X3 [Anarrhichthys ocellatus]|uniref:glucose 1,6-bisphosphate synthase isoform X3 n=1 Tax=Anarrhichthys ocellatus TaxID=433405 RepID=UPI0012EEE08D|nr:glucose 1,6-bisphosphate synthase isoform X3 [Anarrhichthys ocellatus]